MFLKLRNTGKQIKLFKLIFINFYEPVAWNYFFCAKFNEQ